MIPRAPIPGGLVVRLGMLWFGMGGPALHAVAQEDWSAASPLQQQSVAEMLHQAGRGARLLTSAHFALASTAPDGTTRNLLERLEAVYQAHRQFVTDLRLSARPPRHKLEVYFFATHGEFRAHLAALGTEPPDVLGGYEPESKRAAFFDFDAYAPLAAIRSAIAQAAPDQQEKLRRRFDRRREILAQTIVQHEAAHQIQLNVGLFPALDRVPVWLTEGLATLFEVPGPPSGSPWPVNGYRLFEFRKLYGEGRPALGDLRRLLVDDQSWCGGKCYPLAWAVVRYLRDERADGFARLLRMAAEGGIPTDTADRGKLLDELVGPIDKAWIDRFYSATMQLPLDSSAFAE